MDRRRFVASGLVASLSTTVLENRTFAAAETTSRKRIAFLGTVVHQHSHAQHFLDRFAMGYNWGGMWQAPRLDIASIFIDQFPKDDLAKARIAKYKLKAVPTIADALTLGTEKLAVDGVVLIAEHGDYPVNEKGQKRYPRYQWFQEIVKVFEKTGQSCPVFNDKHLSTDWEECVKMVADARRLRFPFLAGFSLPATRRLPSIDLPLGVPLEESVCVGYGGVDSYDIHGLETAQCMSERRQGGEVGVSSVLALKGQKVWEELARPERKSTRQLLVAALSRSHNLPVEGGYPSDPISFDWARKALLDSTAYLIEHRDGFRTTMLLAPIRDFNYAGLRKDTGEILSCQMYLPMPSYGATTADFFNPLARHIENMILTGQAPYPVERTLLTSGMVIGGVDSLHAGQSLVKTPKLAVKYAGPKESTYWRE
ncbi:hypothetical protein KIH39_09450 [Telmatocola sphagniphila]|uniref:Uncharacterized protein n=1 Tax=Telmatocola sphagniphila TaxID=1123043 RepID=A0A8E6B9A1_9BACT|nr:hypothetical protein [Telmatocola sphagniphila]QVL34111.1 hypothetical protein KIH39_09450 [Telmatocola sphagniphila]